jgi:hypothetical protein
MSTSATLYVPWFVSVGPVIYHHYGSWYDYTDLSLQLTLYHCLRMSVRETLILTCSVQRVGKLRFLSMLIYKILMPQNKQTNSVALVRKRTLPIERLPLVGEVVPTFAGQRNGFPRPLISVF